MDTSQTKKRSPSRLKKMMTLCIGSTVLAMLALLFATLLPGSPTGGPDGPYMIAFLLLLAFLYIILPMHVVAGIATIFKYSTEVKRERFIFPLLYFVVWFVALFLYFVFSGAAEPVYEEINDWKFRGQYTAEMELLSALRSNKDHSMVPALISDVNDINLRDPEFGLTALQWAARSAKVGIIKNLLDAGADANAHYQRDWSNSRGTLKSPTVLDIATWSDVDAKEKTLLLLDNGAAPTGQALVGACEAGDLELVDKFHALGIDLQTAMAGDGLSCFHAAAQKGEVELIRALFSKGVSPSLLTKYKLTPLDLAMMEERHRAAIALLKGNAPANQPRRLIKLVASMPQEDFEQAVSHRPLTGLQSADARGALRDAALDCNVTFIRRLFLAGLTLEHRDREMIEIPARCEFRDLMEQLIRP